MMIHALARTLPIANGQMTEYVSVCGVRMRSAAAFTSNLANVKCRTCKSRIEKGNKESLPMLIVGEATRPAFHTGYRVMSPVIAKMGSNLLGYIGMKSTQPVWTAFNIGENNACGTAVADNLPTKEDALAAILHFSLTSAESTAS